MGDFIIKHGVLKKYTSSDKTAAISDTVKPSGTVVLWLQRLDQTYTSILFQQFEARKNIYVRQLELPVCRADKLDFILEAEE